MKKFKIYAEVTTPVFIEVMASNEDEALFKCQSQLDSTISSDITLTCPDGAGGITEVKLESVDVIIDKYDVID